MINWYWDALGRSWHMLGRYDEMVEAFRKGAAAGEDGTPNVSQVINLAQAQNAFGRGDEALRTLAAFADGRKSSPYGEMEMRFARGCAQAVAGRPAEAVADVAFAKAHDKDHGEALADLLLCLGDMDGAAAAFIARLDDPDRRADALEQLSDYDDPPVALPPDPINSRLDALKARPDVKAAIARAGGTRRFHVQAGNRDPAGRRGPAPGWPYCLLVVADALPLRSTSTSTPLPTASIPSSTSLPTSSAALPTSAATLSISGLEIGRDIGDVRLGLVVDADVAAGGHKDDERDGGGFDESLHGFAPLSWNGAALITGAGDMRNSIAPPARPPAQ